MISVNSSELAARFQIQTIYLWYVYLNVFDLMKNKNILSGIFLSVVWYSVGNMPLSSVG